MTCVMYMRTVLFAFSWFKFLCTASKKNFRLDLWIVEFVSLWKTGLNCVINQEETQTYFEHSIDSSADNSTPRDSSQSPR